MPKVLFITQSSTMPSSRIRVLDLIPELEANGLECEAVVLPKGLRKRTMLFKKSKKYDVVVLQKKLLRWIDFTQLRYYARKLIFDFDDAIFLKCASPSQFPEDYVSKTRHSLFRRIVSNVDHVIAANKLLAGKAQSLSAGIPVDVIPSGIKAEHIKSRSSYTLQERPVIGWVGSSSTLRYLAPVEGVLFALQEKYNSILHIVADKSFDSQSIDTVFLPWELNKQYDYLQAFDIGIMPLTNDPFSEGKASYKLLQYLACGLPAVSSAVGMNIDVSNGDTNCLLAHNDAEFFEKIDSLLSDISLRQTLGRNGIKLINDQFTTKVIGNKLSGIINRLTGTENDV